MEGGGISPPFSSGKSVSLPPTVALDRARRRGEEEEEEEMP